MTDIQFLTTDTGTTAYKKTDTGSDVGVFFLPGHCNIFSSHKCNLFEKICHEESLSLTHFTYFGWDGSSCDDIPESGEGYIQHWLDQAIALFDAVTTGPQIICGYSMGGYLALALAQARPERVKGIIGLAAGFGEGLVTFIKTHYDEYRVGSRTEKGFTFSVNEDKSLPILDKLNITCPVRLAHGMTDTGVNYHNTYYVAEAVKSDNVVIHLTKNGLHRLDQPQDEAWLKQTLLELCR